MSLLTSEIGAASTEALADAEETMRQRAERDAANSLFDVVRVTTEIFGGPVTIREGCDPEELDDRYVVFSVVVHDVDEAVSMERDWIQRVREISKVWSAFRLSVKMAE